MKTVILSVYFSGTAHAIQDGQHLASILHLATIDEDGDIKMGFDGCGITNGLMGTLFGTGLEAQCDEVIARVIAQLRLGNRVRVNAYGHSRGGIAALMLAKRLRQYSDDLVETNLCLVDPVPGNFLWTSAIDFTNRTLAKQTVNLTECKNLKKVLVLYPNEPLPSIAAHAPLLCDYPTNCDVVEEIMPGCHAGAQFTTEMDSKPYRKIAFARCYQFLKSLGATFAPDYLYWNMPGYNAGDDQTLLSAYESEFEKAKTAGETTRSSHAKHRTQIIARPKEATFLSAQHANLHFQLNPDESKPRTPLYTFSRPRLQVEPKPKTPMNLIAIHGLFELAKSNMSIKNQKGEKGMRVDALIQAAALVNDENIHDYLRNGIALFLQRDHQRCSLFSRTTSGKALVNLLNHCSDYAAIKQTLLGAQKDRPIRYEDLRCYVTGRNDKTFFAQKNAGTLFKHFEKADNFLENKISYFLPR